MANPKCPFRFKEFTTEEEHQRCDSECALLMESNYTTVNACALAIIASDSATQWLPANYSGGVDDEA